MAQAAPKLDQVVNLVEEMAELVRAGVPLHEGILQWGRGASNRLRRIADQLGSELARGRALPDILADMEDSFPPATSAIVQAGLASGNLPAALDAIARSADCLVRVRRALAQAIIYPTFIVLTAGLVAVWLIFQVVTPATLFFEQLAELKVRWLPWLMPIRNESGNWVPLMIVLLIVPAVLWVLRARTVRRLPVVRMRNAARNRLIAMLVADLLDCGRPLAEAVELAGRASGDRRSEAAMAQWSEQIQRGQGEVELPGGTEAVSPWVSWILMQDLPMSQRVRQLRSTAASYEEDLSSQIHWWTHSFPIWLTISIGGTATAVTALVAYGPWCYVLYRIAP